MRNKYLLTVAALSNALFIAQANADGYQDNRWYLAPFATFVNTGGDRGAQDGWGGGMGIGKILNENFNVELKGFAQEFGSSQGNWRLAGGTADVQYFLSRNKLAPYTVFGLGGMNTQVGGYSNASFIGEAGAGLTYELTDNLSLRGDVRYRYNNNFENNFGRNADEFSDMVINFGFVIPMGDKPVKVAKIDVPVVPVAHISPAPQADCSTMDGDSDGVNNCLDKCPNTMANSKVDHQGCSVSLELKGVNFKLDSAELTMGARSILDTVAANLMNYPERDDIEVRGHTSSEGSDAHNMKLSQRRSQAVADYLKMKGVTNRLIARGFGESQPIAENTTEEGRSMNRRVELIWMGN